MKTDYSIVAQLTDCCNLNCTYCYLDKARPKRNMDLKTVERLISEVHGYNDAFAHFAWVGGEPLLRSDGFLEQIIETGKACNTKGLDISHSIQTNGIELTEDRQKRLRAMGYRLGGSFDGCLDVQKKQRVNRTGQDKTETIIRNYEACRREIGLIAVLTNNLVGREIEAYENLRRLCTTARINFFAPSGGGLLAKDELLPSVENATSSFLEFYRLWKSDDSDFNLNPFSSIVRGFFTGWVKTCDYSAYSCTRLLGVDPDGGVFLCSRSTHMPETKLGNINEISLKEMIGNRVHQKIMDRYFDLKEGDCGGCNWFSICSGGCPIEAKSLSGDFNQKTYYCETKKTLFRKISEDLNDDDNVKRFLRKTKIGGN
ncbi:Coenzyme PQQ synthesis protein E [uncultured archaeon]|nr:Coenzyme PQQ synthesis protein E [uncultured archaeon]